MKRIGLLPQETVEREIAKLIRLLDVKKDLEHRVPSNRIEISCLPIQKDAVNRAIQTITGYLQHWGVDIKAHLK